nr:hypothetical protein [Tanacetum cinerariifolium]
MPNPEDTTNPTTAMNMALALMAKAFKLNYSTPTNNNQKILSNPRNRQLAQPGMNMGQDRQMQMIGDVVGNQVIQNPRVQNVGNQNGLNGVQGNGNQNQIGNGNLVAASTKGNATGQKGNQIRCYNCRRVGHYVRNCTVRTRRRDVAYLQIQLLIAQKEEAGIKLQVEEYDLMAAAADLDEIKKVNANYILMANLQQASTSGTQTDSTPVYDSDGSAEVHENYDDNEIFNMFTQEEQYTELLELIPESHQVSQNDNEVISKDTSVEQGGETRALYDSLYQNLATEVEKVNSANRKLKENNADLATELARYKNQERINPFKTSREETHVPNTVKASTRLKPITVSQPSVFIKKDVNSDLNGLSSTGVDNTKTKRPQPRSNTKNDRSPLHLRDVISKVVCAMFKQCLISVNNDVCLRNYVNGKNSHGKKQKANVSFKENQKKYQPKVTKPKKVGFLERLATPKLRKPRFLLRWSPTGRLFDQKGNIVDSSEFESQPDCSNSDNACCSKHMTGNLKLLINFVWKFIGTVRFRNDHVAAILGFGQFCDLDLEVVFRKNACFVRNLKGVDLLKGDRSTNLYTINLHEMASASPICLMARASSTKSWLWHQRISHLNFDTINDLARNDLVSGLPKFKIIRNIFILP